MHEPSIGNLVDLLRLRAETAGERQAYAFLVDGEHESARLSYAQLDRAARTLAGRLRARIAPGSRVILAYPPGLEFIVAFFGCLYAGLIAVPVSPPHPRKGNERLAGIAVDCEARHLLTTVTAGRWVAAAARQHPVLDAIEVLATDEPGDDAPYPLPPAAESSAAIAFLQYTSGSTRSPRGVRVTHANVLANLAAIHAAEANDGERRGVSWLPAYHDMGLIEGILQPMYGGYPTWLMPHFAFLQRPARWLQAISRYRASVSGGPNFAFDTCVRRIAEAELDAVDLRSWRVAYCGAEPVRAETLRAFATRFAGCGFAARALRPVYGLAESTLLVTASDSAAPGPTIRHAHRARLEEGRFVAALDRSLAVALVSCGKAAAGARIRVLDPESHAVLPERSVGEIWVNGPSVACGYHSHTAAPDTSFRMTEIDGIDGLWLHTGDLGFLVDGELYVSGRSKDLIIVRGRKLHPQDIEHSVQCVQAPAIEAAAAFALDPAGGEAVIVLAELATAGTARAAQFACAPLADAIRADVYRQHDIALTTLAFLRTGALPRTSSGKLMRFRCRQEFMRARLPLIDRFDLPSTTDLMQGIA